MKRVLSLAQCAPTPENTIGVSRNAAPVPAERPLTTTQVVVSFGNDVPLPHTPTVVGTPPLLMVAIWPPEFVVTLMIGGTVHPVDGDMVPVSVFPYPLPELYIVAKLAPSEPLSSNRN